MPPCIAFDFLYSSGIVCQAIPHVYEKQALRIYGSNNSVTSRNHNLAVVVAVAYMVHWANMGKNEAKA